ncbi:unnamed protein product [Peronospora farinosa]|uniref:HMG box domain-containing protein n=1 Tax=Peronospora farinosa TaxID=134698 RepID=A0AAV0U384_9STRA|nr:unnamed protein product [Peronospora farinosa]
MAVHLSWSRQQVSGDLGRQWKVTKAAKLKQWVKHGRFDNETEGHRRRSLQQNDMQYSIMQKKQLNEPRQSDLAYICFWQSRRPEDAKDKLRFQEEIALFQPTLEVATEMSPNLRSPPTDPFAPSPAKTGFQLFMIHNQESFALLSMTINEFSAEMRQLWKRLGDANRKAWYELAKQDEKRYETEMDTYEPPACMNLAARCAHWRVDELRDLARGDAFAPRMLLNAIIVKKFESMRAIDIAWKSLSDDERALFQLRAEEDVERFRKEMEPYLLQRNDHRTATARSAKRPTRKRKELKEQGRVAVRKKVKKSAVRRKKRKSALPRRPKTAYNIMYMSERTELLATYQMSHNECSALCGRFWRQMSETEREPYKQMAADDKRRYDAELEIYNAHVEEGQLEAVT